MKWDKKYRKVDDDDRVGLKSGSVLVHCGAGVSRVFFPSISSLPPLLSLILSNITKKLSTKPSNIPDRRGRSFVRTWALKGSSKSTIRTPAVSFTFLMWLKVFQSRTTRCFPVYTTTVRGRRSSHFRRSWSRGILNLWLRRWRNRRDGERGRTGRRSTWRRVWWVVALRRTRQSWRTN